MAMICQATVPRLELWNKRVDRCAVGAQSVAFIQNCCGIRSPLWRPVVSSSWNLNRASIQNMRNGRLPFKNLENVKPSRGRSIHCDADYPRDGDLEKNRKKSKGLTSLELQNVGSSKIKNSYNGIFLLLLLNLGIFALDHWLHFPIISHLYLHHSDPKWYQFVTATFCHINWTHLSSNLFFLYIFGKLIEEEEGGFAVWLSYLITGVGANLVSWLLLPRSVISAGASGAVFGLFAVSVLVKMSFDWRKILEVLILGQFVVEKVMEEAQASASMGSFALKSSMNINHIAHLSGALLGVLLICLLNRLPSGDPDKK
ncbi:hypothetical protein MPTK1_2g16890 [Marchantia polymorpha subsp. ruderalis]|uniref:Peptidase S54 rhomboid domain-containing protein n=1 Tax=Marchantia polymorpha TaxID=3197 RepID=A0A2R6WCM7_MARPO|nr:hypothetical protein MARPO_0109s0030 [Marchantia polymorpha]PTQ31600.1 hypothetical protein MARPO_0109s0030 [Marchantia polymorpha]BBN02641.1 hypothetical protein Mp_2g16890 [Marchantia polymorpha subsp. ruderalis]BBN02642.1 hypothetical protein Mp_2g16890 [Marchantia polymorpha subsp. ruderalis]|eukprot:PTQ31599.1 hypothetical protein MARPO_0109s0030 [Marchantia polymorpha]